MSTRDEARRLRELREIWEMERRVAEEGGAPNLLDLERWSTAWSRPDPHTLRRLMKQQTRPAPIAELRRNLDALRKVRER